MSNTPHRVRSQRLVVRAGTQEDAFAIRDYLRREWDASLLPAMERAFSEADVPERTIRCSRVELTLRVASPEELAEVLPERIAMELAERLRELTGGEKWSDDDDVRHRDGGNYPGHGYADGGGRDDGRHHADSGGHEDMVVRRSLSSEDRFAVLLGYLRTGALAWSAAHAGAGIAGELREICRRESSRLAGLLRNGSIPAAERFDLLFRLLRLLSDEDGISFIHELLNPLSGEAASEAARIAGMAAGSVPVPSIRYDHLRSAAASLDRVLEGNSGVPGNAVVSSGGEPSAAQAVPDGNPGVPGDAVVVSEEEFSAAIHPSASGSRGWVLWLIERLMEGDAPEVTTRLREGITGRWREPVERAVAESGSVGAGRLPLLRLAAEVLVTNAEGNELSGGEVIGFISRTLGHLGDDEIAGFIRAVLERIAHQWKRDVALVLDAVAGASAGATDDARRRRRFMAHILAASIRAAAEASPPDVARLIEAIAGDADLAAMLERLPPSAGALLRGSDASSGDADAGAVAGAPGPLGREGGSSPHVSGRSVASTDRDESRAADIPQHRTESPAAWIDDSPEDRSSPVMVHYAGLVLLHPFIVPFFQDRGVLEPGSRALAEQNIPRAAALLQFLATGRDEPYEFELGLCKVLLGRELHTPLLIAGGLVGGEDVTEADALLGSVVEHWSALKNTSVDALRESFLRRPGLLRREERRWRLQVEPASFDLLLGHLPWGIGVVRLPWMSEPIHVEWER